MYITHVTEDDLHKALNTINEKIYDGNIRFYSEYGRELERTPSGWKVRLKVHDVKKRGHRWHPEVFKIHQSDWGNIYMKGFGRRSAYACWHVYGHFFEALFEINPKASIRSRGERITAERGNWEDYNVGSQAYPFYASDACFCSLFDELERVDQTAPEQLYDLLGSLSYTNSVIHAIKRLPQEALPLMLGQYKSEPVKIAIEKRLMKG